MYKFDKNAPQLEFFADGRTHRHGEVNCRFFSFAKAPKTRNERSLHACGVLKHEKKMEERKKESS